MPCGSLTARKSLQGNGLLSKCSEASDRQVRRIRSVRSDLELTASRGFRDAREAGLELLSTGLSKNRRAKLATCLETCVQYAIIVPNKGLGFTPHPLYSLTSYTHLSHRH